MSDNILILIITSFNYSHYKDLYKIWKKHLLNANKNITFRFLLTNNSQDEEIVEDGYDLFIKQDETYSPGIYRKTIIGMEYMCKKKDYLCVIRTNLSTFWNFINLDNYIFNLDINLFKDEVPLYTGCPCHDKNISEYIDNSEDYNLVEGNCIFVGGTSIILNKGAYQTLIDIGKKYNFYNELYIPDDILIGFIFLTKDIRYKYTEFSFFWSHPGHKLCDLKNNYTAYRTKELLDGGVPYFEMLYLQYKLGMFSK